MAEAIQVSIIVPIFNAEKYLKRCLESVLNQSYKRLEIILINDGSTDKSPEICDYYATIDARIRVIHKNNGGPSLAREDGIKNASGDFISFVDADDYIDVDMYEILVTEAVKGFDIVECGYREVTTEAELIGEHKLRKETIYTTYNCALHYAAQKNTTNYLWNKLFKFELLCNIEFPKLYAGEDSCILTQVFSKAKRVSIINDILYSYVMTPDSLCRQPFSEIRLDNIIAGKFMYNFYSENSPDLAAFSALHICTYASQLYCKVIDENISGKPKILANLADLFDQYYDLSASDLVRDLSSKKRIIFVELFKRNKKISQIIYRIFG